MDITNETKMAATGINIWLPIALKGKTEKVAAILTRLERDYGYHVHTVTAEDLKNHDSDWAAQAKEDADGKDIVLAYDAYGDEGMPGAVNLEALLFQGRENGFHPVVAVGPYTMDYSHALRDRFLHITF